VAGGGGAGGFSLFGATAEVIEDGNSNRSIQVAATAENENPKGFGVYL
jgi:hypothetical protein